MVNILIAFGNAAFSTSSFILLLSVLVVLLRIGLNYRKHLIRSVAPSLMNNRVYEPITQSETASALITSHDQSPPLNLISSPVKSIHGQSLLTRNGPVLKKIKKTPMPQIANANLEAVATAPLPLPDRLPGPFTQIWETIKEASGTFHILIVDDEPINLQVLENHLSLDYYEVTRANDGLEALKLIKRGQEFDLIILDVMMPQMSGYEVCRRLRKSYPIHELPVVMLTAKNNVSDLVTGFDAGANDYLRKPFNKKELLMRIQTQILLTKMNNAYKRFVPNEFIDLLGKESIIDVELGDQVEKEITLLFSDIRSFTKLSEQMTPQENFDFINHYLKQMSPIIRKHHGFINKYIGDAIMALFAGTATDAIQAAIAMQHRVRHYNIHRTKNGDPPIHIGIGLHGDRAILGLIGDSTRMDTSIISDAVDIVIRLEELTKFYGVSILISEQTLAQVDPATPLNVRFLDKVKVKNHRPAISIFEILDGEPEEIKALKLKTRPDFEQGVAYYQQQALSKAQRCFQQVLTVHPEDTVAQMYLKHIARFVK